MKNGDVVFFKTAKTGTTRTAPEVKFKGMAFGVLLGHVPPFQKAPPPEHLIRLMGTIGFVSFDDVGEFLGAEHGADCVKKFEDKYYGKEIPVDPNAAPEPPTDAPIKIVGLDGQPITSEPADNPGVQEISPEVPNGN